MASARILKSEATERPSVRIIIIGKFDRKPPKGCDHKASVGGRVGGSGVDALVQLLFCGVWDRSHLPKVNGKAAIATSISKMRLALPIRPWNKLVGSHFWGRPFSRDCFAPLHQISRGFETKKSEL